MELGKRRLKRILLFCVLLGLRGATLGASELASSSPSDFDLFLAKLGGTIPFPPREIFEKLGTSASESLIVEVIPHGRSLERSSTDYVSPRTVFVWAQDLNKVDSPRVFLGYTPNKKQLEVISFDSATQKYEFRVVSNYDSSGKSEITEPPRAVCTTCHQGGIPIFSIAPWSETTESSSVLQRLKNETKDPLAQFLLSKKFAFGTAPFVRVSAAEFDQQVRMAEKRASLAHDCASSCRNDIECRRKLLAGFVFVNLRTDKDKYLASVDYGFSLGFPESRLRDRLVVPGKERSLTLESEISSVAPRFRYDPLQPSVSFVPYADGLSFCFGNVNPSDDAKAKAIVQAKSFAEVMSLLKSSKTTDFLAKNWPLSSDQAMAFVLQNFGSTPQVRSESCANCSGSKQKNLDLKRIAIRYCAQCHYGAGSLAPSLPLDELQQLGKYKSPTRGRDAYSIVATFVEKRLMPPEDADQPSDEERAALVEAVRGSR